MGIRARFNPGLVCAHTGGAGMAALRPRLEARF
jgi:hypothetical protein